MAAPSFTKKRSTDSHHSAPDSPEVLITNPTGRSAHAVQFYESEDFLYQIVSDFAYELLAADNKAVLLATGPHLDAIGERLLGRGIDVAAAIREGRYIARDASIVLSQIMAAGRPDRARFFEVIGELVDPDAPGAGRTSEIGAFGEMVAVLWADGNRKGAIELERLWNEFAQTHHFSLLCAYPMSAFSGEPARAPFEEICAEHTRISPAESYSAAGDQQQLLEIAKLQRRAQMLDAEIEKSREAREEAELLNHVSLTLAGELDLGKLVQYATEAATRLTKAKFGAFFYNIIDEEGEAYRLFTLSGASREAFEKFGQPRNTGIFGPTFRGEGVVRIDDVLVDPRYGKNPPYHGMPPGHPPVRSYLAVPVKSRAGEVFGGLFFGHPDPGIFTERAERIATGIAAQSAIAIENARLLDEANRERLAAERSRRLYDAVLSNTPDLAFVFDLNHRFTYANPALLDMWGQTWEEAAGKNCLELGYPDWQAAMHDREIDKVIATKKPIRGEVPFKGSKELRVYDYFFAPVLGSDGAVESIAGTARDITEISRATEDLTRQAQLLDLSNDAIFARDTSGRILYWNTGAERLYGFSRAEALGQHAHTLLHTEFPIPLEEIIARLRRDGHWAGEFVQQTRARERITVWVRKVLSRDEGEGHVLESCTDISERKRAEELLALHRERSELVNAAAQVGYWFCDLPFNKLNWDNRVKEHFWLPPDAEVTIDDFYERLHPDDREPTRRAIEAAISNLSLYNTEYRSVSPDGEKVKWIRAIGRTFCDASGQPKRFDGVTMDISREKLAEEALVRTEKLAAAGRLASTIAHEINNPLECLVNLLYLVRQDQGISAKSRQYLQTAGDQLDRAAHVARQTLGFYRDNTEARWLDISEVVEDLLRLYQHKLRGREVKVENIGDAKKIYASAGDFSQLFSNLLVNAADATEAGKGRIRIRTRPGRDWNSPRRSGISISVADNGCGIAPADMTKIFEPFFTTKQDVGTGLGLWLVRSTMQKYRGSIRVRSCTSSGARGSVFHIFWPDGEQSDPQVPLSNKPSSN